jgi:hypothetical protein
MLSEPEMLTRADAARHAEPPARHQRVDQFLRAATHEVYGRCAAGNLEHAVGNQHGRLAGPRLEDPVHVLPHPVPAQAVEDRGQREATLGVELRKPGRGVLRRPGKNALKLEGLLVETIH